MRVVCFNAWVVVTVALCAVLTLPTGLNAQLGLACTALAILVVLNQFGSGPFVRQVFIVVCLALITKYLYWRVSSTLPPMESGIDVALAVVVLVAELFSVTFLFLSVFVMLDPLPARTAPPLPDPAPTVDVFVPSYNEDLEIVANTLAAAKAMDYDPDKVTVFLLDDGATDEKLTHPNPAVAAAAARRKVEMSELCAALGVVYLARPRNVMAKAGNLNWGLKHSKGELVVVFDADHAPMRHFLKETVGHFAQDKRLFLVQTPHVFLNPDPLERNLGLAGYAPSENEMFYGAVQRGLDSWNAAFFCGSAAVLRRAALEEVDGFSGVSITEDCETALDLHSRGWRSRYVSTPMIRGLQPETFASFIGQRSRWCRGMIQIFLLKSPWFVPGLTIAQRLCYTSSCFFWFFPLVRMVFLAAPLLFIVFDLKIYASSASEFIAYAVPYLLAAILMQGYLFGKYRWPWVSELYEYIQAVYLARAVVTVLLNPRKPTFNVTDKGVTLKESRLSGLALPYYVIFFVLLAATLYTGYRFHNEPSERTLLLVVGGWNLFNLVLAGVALGCVSEKRERRSRPRIPVGRQGTLTLADSIVPVLLEDVSQGGVRLCPLTALTTPLAIGTRGELATATGDGETIRANVVVLNRVTANDTLGYGVSLDVADPRRFGMVTELMYAGSAAASLVPEEARQRRNMLLWTLEVILYALHQTGRGIVFALFRSGKKKGAATHGSAERAAA